MSNFKQFIHNNQPYAVFETYEQIIFYKNDQPLLTFTKPEPYGLDNVVQISSDDFNTFDSTVIAYISRSEPLALNTKIITKGRHIFVYNNQYGDLFQIDGNNIKHFGKSNTFKSFGTAFEVKDVNLMDNFLCFLSFGYFHFYNLIEYAEYVLKTEARELVLHKIDDDGFKIRVGDKMFLTMNGLIQMIETKQLQQTKDCPICFRTCDKFIVPYCEVIEHAVCEECWNKISNTVCPFCKI